MADYVTPATEGGPRFEAYGVFHTIRVIPNENNTGWIVYIDGFGHASANLPQDQADALAAMLLETPGEIIYHCKEHKKIVGPCLPCLM